ncbi:MAG TPA: lysophospholipid acyltransferase family protein [Longimicrobiaceae bacterium]|nr:lysophospholipid acyltransferase family protein [Longimicrobiaceae bacterium]
MPADSTAPIAAPVPADEAPATSPRTLLERVSFGVRAGAAVAGTGVAFGVCAAGLAMRLPREGVVVRSARLWARLVCAPLGIRLRVHGRERLSAHRPCVIVANHQSALDVAFMAGIFPRGTVILAKEEVRAMPIVGRIYRATGNLFVERERPRNAHRALQQAEAAVRAGSSLWIFPEGTWGPEPGRLLPFKAGAFRLAVATGAPVVPVVIAPLKPRVDLEGGRIRRTVVHAQVLEPIPTAGMTDTDVQALLATTQQRMQAELDRLADGPLRV